MWNKIKKFFTSYKFLFIALFLVWLVLLGLVPNNYFNLYNVHGYALAWITGLTILIDFLYMWAISFFIFIYRVWNHRYPLRIWEFFKRVAHSEYSKGISWFIIKKTGDVPLTCTIGLIIIEALTYIMTRHAVSDLCSLMIIIIFALVIYKDIKGAIKK